MVTLDDDELAIVQRGRAGMRRLRNEEQALVATSELRRARERTRRRTRRLVVRSAAVVVLAGISSGLYLWWQSLQRADFDCGMIDTHARATCTGPRDLRLGCDAPQDWSDAEPPREPDKVPFPLYRVKKHCRGDAIALSEGRATCRVERSRDELDAEVAFYATIGGRCGAWATCENGLGGVQPVWSGHIDLTHGDWSLTVTAVAVRAGLDVPMEVPTREWPGSTCKFSIDKHVLGSLDLGLLDRDRRPIKQAAPVHFVEDKLSGGHELILRCEGPPEARSCTGGPPLWTTSDESFLVTVHAHRLQATARR